MTTKPAQQYGIKDNHTRGRVADFLSAIILSETFPVVDVCAILPKAST